MARFLATIQVKLGKLSLYICKIFSYMCHWSTICGFNKWFNQNWPNNQIESQNWLNNQIESQNFSSSLHKNPIPITIIDISNKGYSTKEILRLLVKFTVGLHDYLYIQISLNKKLIAKLKFDYLSNDVQFLFFI